MDPFAGNDAVGNDCFGRVAGSEMPPISPLRTRASACFRAVGQRLHRTGTTNRIAGVDFRLPTEDELDALEAFQLSLGRKQEIELPLALKN